MAGRRTCCDYSRAKYEDAKQIFWQQLLAVGANGRFIDDQAAWKFSQRRSMHRPWRVLIPGGFENNGAGRPSIAAPRYLDRRVCGPNFSVVFMDGADSGKEIVMSREFRSAVEYTIVNESAGERY